MKTDLTIIAILIVFFFLIFLIYRTARFTRCNKFYKHCGCKFWKETECEHESII